MIPESGYHEWAASKQSLQAPPPFFSFPGNARLFSFSTRKIEMKFSHATSYLYNEKSFFRLLNLVSVPNNSIPGKCDILSELE